MFIFVENLMNMTYKNTTDAYLGLLALAEQKGISRYSLAEKLKMTPQQINNNMRRGKVKIETVGNLAKVLGCVVEIKIKSLTDK